MKAISVCKKKCQYFQSSGSQGEGQKVNDLDTARKSNKDNCYTDLFHFATYIFLHIWCFSLSLYHYEIYILLAKLPSTDGICPFCLGIWAQYLLDLTGSLVVLSWTKVNFWVTSVVAPLASLENGRNKWTSWHTVLVNVPFVLISWSQIWVLFMIGRDFIP